MSFFDDFSCPVDNFVFPGLDRSREGDGLEARFNAFKIPESNFLVFEATVKTCREGCQPAYCTGQTGRSEPSFGRRRREITEDDNSTEVTTMATSATSKVNTSTEKLVSALKTNPTEHVVTFEAVRPTKRISFASTTVQIPTDQVITAGGRPPLLKKPEPVIPKPALKKPEVVSPGVPRLIDMPQEEITVAGAAAAGGDGEGGPEEQEYVREMIKVSAEQKGCFGCFHKFHSSLTCNPGEL